VRAEMCRNQGDAAVDEVDHGRNPDENEPEPRKLIFLLKFVEKLLKNRIFKKITI